MSDLALLTGIVLLGAGWYALALWWFEARTTWMSRLSARGRLEGHYEPYSAGGWGSRRWLVRERIRGGDIPKLRVLSQETDSDATTDLWRVRTNTRRRLLWISAPAVLVGPFLLSALVHSFD
jgi:hypothetical protein